MTMDNEAVFKALADYNRRLILDELSERNELTLYELTVRLTMKHNVAITRQGITKHIQILEEAGLVVSKRNGKYRVLVFDRTPLNNILNRWVNEEKEAD